MIKVGIIGTGSISESHLRGYAEHGDACKVVALCDIVPGKARAKADKHGLTEATCYEDAADLLAAGGIDLVSIATPPSTHAALTIAALEAGVHVIVEKPMAPSLQECDAMIAAQQASGKVLSVVAQNRFRDDLATLKEALESGLIGSVSHVRIDSAWWRGLSYYDLWWRGTWESEGGGCTLNHAIHHIDLLLWLMGRPSEVAAMLANAQHDNAEVEDLSAAILRYGRGLAELTSSVVHHGQEQTIVVQGELASISQPWQVVAEVSQPNGFPIPGGDAERVAALNQVAADHTPLAHIGHAGQLGDVLGAIRADRPPRIGGEDGRNAVEVVTAIYKSGIERQFVALPLAPDDPYYLTNGLLERAPHFFEKSASKAELVGDITVGGSSAEA